jgi:hypothetical protein
MFWLLQTERTTGEQRNATGSDDYSTAPQGYYF